MTLQNRVLPTGKFVAHPARVMFMGNRGILHDDSGKLTNKRWKIQGWVTCSLEFKKRRRFPLMRPGNYTELFFWDEAVALAAGHRPCAECLRADYLRYRSAVGIEGPVADLDRHLHKARAVPRTFGQRTHRSEISRLPDGVFIRLESGPCCLVQKDVLLPFQPDGYQKPTARPRSGDVEVLTPEPSVAAMAAGYHPVLNLSAIGSA